MIYLRQDSHTITVFYLDMIAVTEQIQILLDSYSETYWKKTST